MPTYFKSQDFPIHLLAAWWIFWLAASYTDLNDLIPPSGETLAQYALLIVSFLFGHYTIKHRRAPALRAPATCTRALHAGGSTPMRVALRLAALVCTAMLLLSLQLSGAVTSDFVGYFTQLRQEEVGVESLTGIHVLDVLTKVLAFPLSYAVILVVLAKGVQHFRFTLLLCIFNLLAFSYLWQVNYPLIHLFWLLVFYSLVQVQRRGSLDWRTVAVTLVLFSTLVASAVNRFGGDTLGAFQRYIVGYHLIGFSFYDYQYQDPNSILHVHSYGRSSLGFLDQILEAASKTVDAGYKAASSENSTYNAEAVDIGLNEIKEVNAFGTLLFGLYRDFHLLGVAAGGFIYGALSTHALYRSARDWASCALFMLLATSWMIGMMVNPIEQAYFWFVVVALGVFTLLNREIRH